MHKQAGPQEEFRKLLFNRMISIAKSNSPVRNVFHNAVIHPKGNGVFEHEGKVLATTMFDPKTTGNFTPPHDLNPVGTALALRKLRNSARKH
jgi:hypothetical protein